LCEEKASEIFLDRTVSFKRIIEYKNLYLQLKNEVSNKIKLLLRLARNSTIYFITISLQWNSLHHFLKKS